MNGEIIVTNGTDKITIANAIIALTVITTILVAPSGLPVTGVHGRAIFERTAATALAISGTVAWLGLVRFEASLRRVKKRIELPHPAGRSREPFVGVESRANYGFSFQLSRRLRETIIVVVFSSLGVADLATSDMKTLDAALQFVAVAYAAVSIYLGGRLRRAGRRGNVPR